MLSFSQRAPNSSIGHIESFQVEQTQVSFICYGNVTGIFHGQISPQLSDSVSPSSKLPEIEQTCCTCGLKATFAFV